MKKKLLSSILCAAMVGSLLVGCGTETGASTAESAAAALLLQHRQQPHPQRLQQRLLPQQQPHRQLHLLPTARIRS
jgi:hypothetical protein